MRRGGGGTTPSANPTLVSGVASKGPLSGSSVCAFAITGGVKGAPIGSCTTTDAAGNYSINLGIYTGSVLFQATGGTYVDEATGAIVTLTSPLDSVLLNATGGNASVAITALTELAYQNASALTGGLTSGNIQSAIASVQNNFGVSDIVNTMPVDALNMPASATAAQKTYALALAALSQYLQGPPVTTLAVVLQTMQACLAAPTTACGTGVTSLGAILNAALTTFKNSHPAFSGVTLPLASFGSSNSSGGSIVLTTVKQLNNATVGKFFSQNVVAQIVPTSRYTYSIDTLANGVTPTGMTLNMNGILSGTPFATGATDVNGFQIPHTYTFGVCATDTLSRTMTTPCPQTSITVIPLAMPITGTWSGTWAWSGPGSNGCSFSDGGSFSMVLTQTGSSFSGTASGAGVQVKQNGTCIYMTTIASSGTTSGSISGTALNLVFDLTDSYGTMSFNGTATLDVNTTPNTLTANFVRSTGGSGTFTLTRQ